MFKWSVLLLLFGKFLCVNCQTLKYAEKRVINGAGMDYAFQEHLSGNEPSQGLSGYSSFAQKMPEQLGELPKNVRTIIVTKKVPVPYPVQVEKKVPVPVKVPIRRPYAVYVPRPYYVEVMKQVPVPIKVPVPQPYTVEKHVPFPYKVHYDRPFPVHITKPYPVYYEKRVPINVEKPVAVPYRVQVDRPMPVNIPMERPMYYAVQRPYPFPVKVPVDNPVTSQVHKPITVPVTVEKPHLAESEHAVLQDYYTSTQPTVHNTFSPSPYDEMTSTMLTEGKHKVISFLPGSQNTFGSYGSSSADLGTIHVSSNRGNGGNSTDWVPKSIQNQYLTYIPNNQPKFLQYTVPEKASTLQEVNNAEPYVVKHGSEKMHYKLHYDPTKKEYSFQLVPKSPSNQFGHHTGYSYQAVNDESNQDQNSPPTEYVYKTLGGQNLGSTVQFPTKSSGDGLTYSYQHVYQGKPDVHSAQQGSDSPTLTYYPSEEQKKLQYKHETPYTFQTVDSGSKATYDTNGQVTGKPEVTYSYQPTQTVDRKPQQLSPDPHQGTYTYETVVGDSKLDSKPQQLSTDPHQVTYTYQTNGGDSKLESKPQQLSPDPHQVTYTYQTNGGDSKLESKPQQLSPDPHQVTYTYQTNGGESKLESKPQQLSPDPHQVTYTYQTNGGESKLESKPQQLSPDPHQVTYTYQTNGGDIKLDSKPQQLSPDPHHVAYTYQTVGGDSKLSFEPHFESSGTYPNEHVSYMYFSQPSNSHPHSGTVQNAEAKYSISSEQNGLGTEYPQILYQQGRSGTIFREQYVTPVPITGTEGKIPENSKSSRTLESLSYSHLNDTRGSSEDGNDRDDQHGNEIMSTSISDNERRQYQLHTVHSTSYNQTNDDAPTSSIKFETFGVADVMSGTRTKLYPVKGSSGSQLQRGVDYGESSSSTSTHEQGVPLEQYNFQRSEKSSDVTEGPFNAKVYRLSSYEVPRPRRVTRTKLKKNNDVTQTQDQTVRFDEDIERPTTLSPAEWYEFFGSDQSKPLKNVLKESNSHTGAAERAPFYGFSTSTGTTATTNTLQQPDEAISIKPTESLRSRSRGSVKAYEKRKVEPSTEGNSTSTTTRTRRRKRPARRRMDKVTESPLEEK